MKRVQSSEDEWRRVTKAAEIAGERPQDFVREAIRERCNRVEGDMLGPRLARVAGSIDTGGRVDARKTGRAYTELLMRRRRERRAR